MNSNVFDVFDNVFDDHRADEHIMNFIEKCTKQGEFQVQAMYKVPRESFHGMKVNVRPDGPASSLKYTISAHHVSPKWAEVLRGHRDGFDDLSEYRYAEYLFDPLTETLTDLNDLRVQGLLRRCRDIPARDHVEILAKLAIAKVAFKRICGLQPDAGLRVHVLDFVPVPSGYIAPRTSHATHDMIRADQEADLAISVDIIRRRAAARVIRDRWLDVLGNPHNPIGKRWLMHGFEIMAKDPAYKFVERQE
jgi:hypothetical protein